MQTRYFYRKYLLITTLFRSHVETVLFGVLTCFLSSFLAHGRLEADRQSGFINQIGHAALLHDCINTMDSYDFLRQILKNAPAGRTKKSPPANAGGEPLNKSYSIAIELPEASFLGSSFGTMIVRTPYSYFALMFSGLISPTKKLRWQTPA